MEKKCYYVVNDDCSVTKEFLYGKFFDGAGGSVRPDFYRSYSKPTQRSDGTFYGYYPSGLVHHNNVFITKNEAISEAIRRIDTRLNRLQLEIDVLKELKESTF